MSLPCVFCKQSTMCNSPDPHGPAHDMPSAQKIAYCGYAQQKVTDQDGGSQA